MTNEEKLAELEAFASEGDRLTYLGIDLLIEVIGQVDSIDAEEPVIACAYYDPGAGFKYISFYHDNLKALKIENERGTE